MKMQASGAMRRENAASYSIVVTRLCAQLRTSTTLAEFGD
jgi:hypothetical protein